MYGPGFCFRTCPMLSCAHVLHRLHASSPAGFVMTRSAATGINRRRLSKASHLHVPAPLSPAVFTLAVFTLRTLVRGRHLVQILYHVMYHTSAARCCYTAALFSHTPGHGSKHRPPLSLARERHLSSLVQILDDFNNYTSAARCWTSRRARACPTGPW